jgi:predicted CopG family antitoxin
MSQQVRLDDDVYERIKSQKRDDETFSEAIDRLTGEWTLLDFADGDPVVDAETHRKALEQSEQQGIEETKARLERLGVEVDE